MMTDQHTLKFSVNNWQHLYSLKDAIRNAEEVSGKTLTISGTVRNDDLLAEHDTKIAIQFHQIAHFPQYATTTNNEII